MVRVKFGDSRSNGSRYERLLHSLTDNRRQPKDPVVIGQNALRPCVVLPNKVSTNWWGRQNAAPLKFDPKPSEAAFSAVLRTSINAD